MIKINKILPLLILFLFAFTLPLNPPQSGWYQQFMPNLGGRQIKDIFFLDSLTGWAVTPYVTQNDTTYVLKTTNGGDNWFIQFTGTGQFVGRNRIYFINSNTGFSCGNDHYSGSTKITKTTDGGNNWFSLNDPTTAVYDDMYVLNEQTIWLVSTSSLTGGVYRTTNGGVNWDRQFSGGNQNPNRIYMYNARIGFMSNNSPLPNIYKTTNGGENWTVNLAGENFTDMHFVDSLAGWKCSTAYNQVDSSVKKTTNGGLDWFKQQLPHGPNIIQYGMISFYCMNKDTVWGVSSTIFYPNTQVRGILYRTIDGGSNWLFQVPDTSIHIALYYFIKFTSNLNGWVYTSSPNTGIHTTLGGDPIWYTGIKQISINTPNDFKLFQNYPNPFNPRTVIKYEIKRETSIVKLSVYDITGKHLINLVDQKQNAGTYGVDFSGNRYSSGVYFYKITISSGKEVFTDTKKMILLK